REGGQGQPARGHAGRQVHGTVPPGAEAHDHVVQGSGVEDGEGCIPTQRLVQTEVLGVVPEVSRPHDVGTAGTPAVRPGRHAAAGSCPRPMTARASGNSLLPSAPTRRDTSASTKPARTRTGTPPASAAARRLARTAPASQ